MRHLASPTATSPQKLSTYRKTALCATIFLSTPAFACLAPATNCDDSSSHSTANGPAASARSHRLALNQAEVPIVPTAATEGSVSTSHRRNLRRPKLQEVIVTAQQYRQSAFDVPISLAVIGETELQRQQILSLNDLQFSVPGLAVQADGSQRRVSIRGVSNIFGSGGLIGEYIDDAAVTESPSFVGISLDLRTFDLRRVEVLRGPQGTLYGEGSIGGTVRYITNPPDLSQFDFRGSAAETFTKGGSPEQLFQAVLNTPVMSDTLGFRIAGEFDHGGGWINQPAASRKAINSTNLVNVRFEGLWRPLPHLNVSAMETIYRNSFGPNEGSDTSDNFSQPFLLTVTPHIESAYSISNATIRYSDDHNELISSTTYFRDTPRWHDTSSRFQDGFLPAGPVFGDFIPAVSYTANDLSEELRFTHAVEGAWRITFGGFARRYDDSQTPYEFYLSVPGPLPSPIPEPPESIQSRSWSTFADVNYRLFSRLTLGAGARYFRDDQTFTSGAAQTGHFRSTDPRFYAKYSLTHDVNLYLNVAKGFRSGGFNSLGFPPYGPESMWSYELGSKMHLLQRTLALNADVFYSDYQDYVTVGYTVTSPAIISRNSGTVHIKGAEASLQWSPSLSWLFSITGDYINGRFVKLTVLSPDYLVGDPIDQVPRYQFTASAERDFLWRQRTTYVRVDYTQRSPETYRLRSIGPWYYDQSNYLYLLNISAGVQWTDSLKFDIYAKNLLNDRAYLDPFAIENSAARTQPINVGLQFTVDAH